MTETKIIGIVLIKNEDLHIERVIRNIVNFCDSIIITDNKSQDHTFEIIQVLAREFPKISVQQIEHPRESQKAIEGYAGTPTWIFVADGDEVNDPIGLETMRKLLLDGHFNKDWSVFNNSLNCVKVDYQKKIAWGYLTPPSRPVARLYNFAMIESWTGCPERLHGGSVTFKPGYNENLRHYLHEEYDWDHSFFRCVHLAFVRRSSIEKNTANRGRLNPFEIEELRKTRNWRFLPSYLKLLIQHILGRDWKNQKYRRGALVSRDITAFL